MNMINIILTIDICGIAAIIYVNRHAIAKAIAKAILPAVSALAGAEKDGE